MAPLLRFCLPVFLCFAACSCWAFKTVTPLTTDSVDRSDYSRREKLLYYLDLGMTHHYEERYRDSNKHFAEAKQLGERLFTKSISRAGASFLLNDYVLEYRGEDFELALIHLFMALNYLELGSLEDALVEARQLDSKLNVIRMQHGEGRKMEYKEDAFIRFIAGLLYEMEGRLDEAQVDYMKSEEIFADYEKYYGTPVPDFVIENLLSAADGTGFDDRVVAYQMKYPDVSFVPYKKKRELAEVIVIHYNGRSPVKENRRIPVGVDNGVVMHLAFPEYQPISRPPGGAKVTLDGEGGSSTYEFETIVMENIQAIAMRELQNRIVWIQAKAIARLQGQYLLAKEQEKQIREKYGEEWARVFGTGMAALREMAAQADTRSWRSLPAEIRVGRSLVEPGRYQAHAILPGGVVRTLGKLDLAKHSKKFILIRSY